MDRPLDDVISERQKGGYRGNRGRGRGRDQRPNGIARNDARKWNSRADATDIDTDWVHDKYEDDPHTRPLQRETHRNGRLDRYSPEPERSSPDARIRVDNLHYDLTEEDLEDLFTRIAPVSSLSLRFDRAGRSTGTAYVTYAAIGAAHRAIREFDGANAAGQPIRLTLLPTAPASDLIRGRGAASRNPFDTAVKPRRSLFDRVEEPHTRRRGGRSRSRSPGVPRRSDISKAPPEGVDRYVPGDRDDGRRRRSRTRSPPRRRRSPARRGRGGGPRKDRDDEGHKLVGGRPRKTQEDLDKEMEDYWGAKAEINGAATTTVPVNAAEAAAAPATTVEDEDIDMIT